MGQRRPLRDDNKDAIVRILADSRWYDDQGTDPIQHSQRASLRSL
jgi:hypothetical protein